MTLLIENIIRGIISSVMGDRYVKSDDNKKIMSKDATIIYGHSMSQMLPYNEINMWNGHPDIHMDKSEENINTPDDNYIGYFVQVERNYPENIKGKTKHFLFCPEIKKINPDKFNGI